MTEIIIYIVAYTLGFATSHLLRNTDASDWGEPENEHLGEYDADNIPNFLKRQGE